MFFRLLFHFFGVENHKFNLSFKINYFIIVKYIFNIFHIIYKNILVKIDIIVIVFIIEEIEEIGV